MTAPVPPAPKPEDIQAQYGFVALLARAVPEVGALLNQARTEAWTTDRFNMAVANTNWWKNTAQADRQWFIQQIADPASAARELENGGSQIQQIAGQIGIAGNLLSPQKASEIWLHSKLNGYNEQQLRSWLFNTVAKGADSNIQWGGEYGELINRARTMAGAYGYRASEEELRMYAGGGLTFGAQGQAGLSGFEAKLKSYARSKYAPFADRIDAGETVEDIARPYREVYSQVLEVNPEDVGLDDRYMQRWLQGDGSQTAAPVWKAAQELRSDSRWQYTRNAWDSTAKAAQAVGKAFGMVG